MLTEPAPGPDRLLAYLKQGRLLRCKWVGQDNRGRRTLCALAALSEDVATAEDPAACPASLCPEWVADLVLRIDDETSAEAWPGLMRRLGESARRWGEIDEAGWERVRRAWLVDVLDEAVSHVTIDVWGVHDAVARVRMLLVGGGTVGEEWRASGAAAKAAAWAADAADATEAAWAAEAAAWAAARAASAAVLAAAEAAAEAAARVAGDAGDAAAAWDRFAMAFLARIDAHLAEHGAGEGEG